MQAHGISLTKGVPGSTLPNFLCRLTGKRCLNVTGTIQLFQEMMNIKQYVPVPAEVDGLHQQTWLNTDQQNEFICQSMTFY